MKAQQKNILDFASVRNKENVQIDDLGFHLRKSEKKEKQVKSDVGGRKGVKTVRGNLRNENGKPMKATRFLGFLSRLKTLTKLCLARAIQQTRGADANHRNTSCKEETQKGAQRAASGPHSDRRDGGLVRPQRTHHGVPSHR